MLLFEVLYSLSDLTHTHVMSWWSHPTRHTHLDDVRLEILVCLLEFLEFHLAHVDLQGVEQT